MSSSKDSDNQVLSAQLREKFLQFLLFAVEKETVFSLHENTSVKGMFAACDSELLQIIVTDLQTPSGLRKEAILRTSDIISFTMDINADDDK